MTNLIACANLSQLIIVDIQSKLSPAMPKDGMQQVIKNSAILAQAAQILAISTIVTEQYPQGLGETMPEIMQYLIQTKPIAKIAFSACGEPKFNQQLHRDKPQIVLAGMEAHICVLQTALDLLQLGKQVFVVEDAIISRNASNKANAVARLRDAGGVITNTESMVFEWLGDASQKSFKTISQLIK